MIKRQFWGILPFEGVLHQKAQRVDLGNTRGIVFDRPERWMVNTPIGQLEIYPGDWMVEFLPGRYYIVKDSDMAAMAQPAKKKRWKLW